MKMESERETEVAGCGVRKMSKNKIEETADSNMEQLDANALNTTTKKNDCRTQIMLVNRDCGCSLDRLKQVAHLVGAMDAELLFFSTGVLDPADTNAKTIIENLNSLGIDVRFIPGPPSEEGKAKFVGEVIAELSPHLVIVPSGESETLRRTTSSLATMIHHRTGLPVLHLDASDDPNAGFDHIIAACDTTSSGVAAPAATIIADALCCEVSMVEVLDSQ